MKKWLKRTVTFIISLLIIYYIRSNYGSYKTIDQVAADYNNKKSSTLYWGEAGYFNIDSLMSFIKSDSTIEIKYFKFQKEDSLLLIVIVPKFDYKDDLLVKTFMYKINQRYDITHSTNISGLAFIKAFPKDSAKSRTFTPEAICVYTKPHSLACKEFSKP